MISGTATTQTHNNIFLYTYIHINTCIFIHKTYCVGSEGHTFSCADKYAQSVVASIAFLSFPEKTLNWT